MKGTSDEVPAKDEGAVAFMLAPDAVFRDRYRVVRCIKAGGMGAVYEVVDGATNSRRALKVMLATVVFDTDLRSRFVLEAKITGEIESEHITRVLDAGVDETTRTPFMIMELLRGEDLGAVLEKRGALPPTETVHYAYQAALGLEKTHAAGIVHRDLKPENLFVTRRDDGSPCVKLLDFGIAKLVEGSDPDKATRAMGTPLYMAPEQVRGEGSIGPPTDVYALGNVVYTLLVGEPYWASERESSESGFMMMLKIIEGASEPASARAESRRGVALPPAFDAWFAKATAPKAEDRFPGAMASITALAEALDAELPRPRFAGEGAGPSSDAASGGSGPRDAVKAKSNATPAMPEAPSSPSGSSLPVKTDTTATKAADTAPGDPVSPAKRRGVGVFVAAGAAVLAIAGGVFVLGRSSRDAPTSAHSAITSEPVATASLVPVAPTVAPAASVSAAGPAASASAVAPAASAASAAAASAPSAAANAGAARPRPTAAPQPTSPKKHGIF